MYDDHQKSLKMHHDSAKKHLEGEFKDLITNPLEGAVIDLKDNNIFEWHVGIFGPLETLYEGGYFKATMTFAKDYPYSPPKLKFVNNIFHPNIYTTGDVCISILHSPIFDPRSGERDTEIWTPVQSVRSVIVSIISLLDSPNIESPANVDASNLYKRWIDKKDSAYNLAIRKCVQESLTLAKHDGVKIPTTLAEYFPKKPIEDDTLQASCDVFYDFDMDDENVDYKYVEDCDVKITQEPDDSGTEMN